MSLSQNLKLWVLVVGVLGAGAVARASEVPAGEPRTLQCRSASVVLHAAEDPTSEEFDNLAIPLDRFALPVGGSFSLERNLSVVYRMSPSRPGKMMLALVDGDGDVLVQREVTSGKPLRLKGPISGIGRAGAYFRVDCR